MGKWENLSQFSFHARGGSILVADHTILYSYFLSLHPDDDDGGDDDHHHPDDDGGDDDDDSGW